MGQHRYPFLSYVYAAQWTPFVTFDAAVKAEGYDLGEVCLAFFKVM